MPCLNTRLGGPLFPVPALPVGVILVIRRPNCEDQCVFLVNGCAQAADIDQDTATQLICDGVPFINLDS